MPYSKLTRAVIRLSEEAFDIKQQMETEWRIYNKTRDKYARVCERYRNAQTELKAEQERKVGE